MTMLQKKFSDLKRVQGQRRLKEKFMQRKYQITTMYLLFSFNVLYSNLKGFSKISEFYGVKGWYAFWAFWGVFIHVGAVVTAWVSPSFFRVPTTGTLLLLLGETLEAYSNFPFLSPDSILSPARTRSTKLAGIYRISFSW